MTVFIIIVLLLIIFLGAGYYLVTQLIYPQTLSHEQIIHNEEAAGRFNREEWAQLPKEEVWIESPYGYKLYGMFIPSSNSHKTVIISHGITSNLFGMYKYLPLFTRRGFNVMLYDLRHHGKSGGRDCTFGYFEKYDLKAVTDWVFTRMGGAGMVGLHGESLGAAVSLQAAGIDDRLAFVIEDCGYSDLTRLLGHRIQSDYHMPSAIFLPVANFLCTIITGMSFETISPVRDVRDMTLPVLFIHGDHDGYIPPEMCREMYHAKVNGIREMHLMEGARHAESFISNRAEYNQVVGQFLTRIGMD
jgi:uncharacterized protein